MKPALALSLLALLLPACGDAPQATVPAPAAWPTAEERTFEPDHAPTPYTAAQIRVACPPGRLSTYRIEELGKSPYLQSFLFTHADENGARIEIRLTDPDGVPLGDPVLAENSWKSLQGHGSYPLAGTVITEGDVDVPAGSFPCFHYLVTETEEGKTTVTAADFAKTLPGPPVRLSVTMDGRLVRRMTLVAHEPGDG